MTNTSFTNDYGAARTRFLAAAGKAGARLESHILPGHTAPDGTDLAIDVAWLVPLGCKSILFVSSGMHGFEGPAGSAVQSRWLEQYRGTGTAGVCLVHALNPWGFAWVSRLTENNVDLNRNFIDWSNPPPQNPWYARVRDLVRVADMSPETLMRLFVAQQQLATEIGPAAAHVAVDFGQFEDPEGISFGGSKPEFAHLVLRDKVAPQLQDFDRVGVIDWHTGVGAFGEVAILPIDGPGSANATRLHAWWGRALVESWKRSPLEERIASDPNLANLPLLKTGQMKQALRRWLPGSEITGAIIEFGTEREGALPDLIYVTLYERWLRFVDRSHRMAAAHERFRSTARRCFVPDDEDWRALVLREGPKLIDQALAGMA